MKVEEYEKARELRKMGCSIRDITKRLGVAKSSVSIWTKDIELTKEQMEVLSRNKAVQYVNIANEAKRKMEEAKIRHAGFSKEGKIRAKTDISFRVLCGLYWGEGSKEKNSFVITNCSADMLRVIGDWLVEEGFEKRIRFNIGYHLDNCISEIEIKKHWMNELKWLSEDKINKMTQYKINRASQKKLRGRQPFGTAKLCVHDTKLANMVKGGIEYLKEKGL